MAVKKVAHKGFKATAKEIAKKQGISVKGASAILASSARKASPAARAKNPSLNKISGMPKLKCGGKKK